MASGSNNLTTYYAKRIIGDTAAANASSALLQTGDSISVDTWILNRTNRASLYGIKYEYDNSTNGTADKIELYGGYQVISADTPTAWVRLDTGDVHILGKVGIGYDPNTTGNNYKLYVNGSAYFNIGTDSTSDLNFVINGSNAYLSFSGQGIKSFTSADANNTLFLNYDGGQTQIGGSSYLVGSVGIGYNPDTNGNTYKLYVNGTSYFNGNTTHNGIDYFANGTTYYIDNSGDSRLRYEYANAHIGYDSAGFISSISGSPWPYIRFDTRAGGSTFVTTAQTSWCELYAQVPAKNGSTYYSSRFFFREYSKTANTTTSTGHYETYYLPAATDGLTADIDYGILTTKNTVTTAQGGTGNTSYTATRLIYSESATKLASADHIYVLNNYLLSNSRNNQTVDIRANGLIIYGATYGNTAAEMLSNTGGVFRFSDGGPQIIFNTSASFNAQAGELIFTDHDTAATGASFHFVTTESSDNDGGNLTVTAPRFRARKGLAVGQNSDNTTYKLYVNGTSYFSDNIVVASGKRIGGSGGSLYIGNSGNESWVYVQDMASQDSSNWKLHTNGNMEMIGRLWIKGGSEAGSNTNRLTTTSGMPGNMQYNQSRRGTQIYANGIAFCDPYNGNSNNDASWIRHQETTGNSGELEIAVGDDGNETIVVRQYQTDNTVKRTLTLLNANGYSYFPSYINIGGHEKNASSPTYVWGSNSSDNFLRSYQTSKLSVATSASCSGNAASATKLETARNINGTSFNGTAAITTTNWGTSRTLTIGGTGKSVNGSGNVSWSKAEILGSSSNAYFYRGDQAWSNTINGTLYATTFQGNVTGPNNNNLALKAGFNNVTLYIQGDGNMVLNKSGTNVWNSGTGSSYLMKQNIRPITNLEISNFDKLNVISFNYKPQLHMMPNKRYGLIAEEVINLYPNLVNIPEDYTPSKFDVNKGLNQPYISLNYEGFIPLLIKMVQIQRQEINDLKKQLTQILDKI